MKHKDGSTDKYKDKYKEKRREEKVNKSTSHGLAVWITWETTFNQLERSYLQLQYLSSAFKCLTNFRSSPLTVKSNRKKKTGLPGESLQRFPPGFFLLRVKIFGSKLVFFFSPLHVKSELDDTYHSPKNDKSLKRERDDDEWALFNPPDYVLIQYPAVLLKQK